MRWADEFTGSYADSLRLRGSGTTSHNASCQHGGYHTHPINTMQLKTILNRIQKHPGFVFERAQFVECREGIQIHVCIRERPGSYPVCSGCGKKCKPFAKLAGTLREHRDLLLNWFSAREAFAAGAVEGFNLKARVTTRMAYGFRSYDHAEIALYHRLGNLPEPDWLTHRFT